MKDDPASPTKDSHACIYYEEKLEDAEPTDRGEPEKQSQADRLVTICLQKEPKLFTDQTGTPFAWVNQKGVNVTVPLRSRAFRSWLSGRGFQVCCGKLNRKRLETRP
jgi:hypothetical protein